MRTGCPCTPASSMNAFARLLSRGSAFKYQIAAWVSLTALGVIYLLAETFPIDHGAQHQYLLRSDRRRGLSIIHREAVKVVFFLPLRLTAPQDQVRSPRSIVTFAEVEAVLR